MGTGGLSTEAPAAHKHIPAQSSYSGSSCVHPWASVYPDGSKTAIPEDYTTFFFCFQGLHTYLRQALSHTGKAEGIQFFPVHSFLNTP